MAERLGDIPGLRIRDVGPSELSPELRRGLTEACAADANIAAMQVAWMSAGDAAPELLAVLTLSEPNERSVAAFLERANALAGPRCTAVVSSGGDPEREQYYRRSR